MIKLAATIGDLCNIDVNSCGDLLLNMSRFEEYIGKIVKIIPHNLETDKIEYGQLISTRNNACKFKRKDRTTFKIDEQDIKIIEILKSPNYKGGK